jgi:hypothetical protein
MSPRGLTSETTSRSAIKIPPQISRLLNHGFPFGWSSFIECDPFVERNVGAQR